MAVCDDETNDTLGISVIHGSQIPRLYAHVRSLEQSNVPERRKLTLSVFIQKDSPTMKEIGARLEDNNPDISDFYKSNKRVLEGCQFRKPTYTKWLSH